MGSAISTTSRSDTVAQKSNESFEECEQFRGRLQLRSDSGQWKKYEISFDGTQITCPLWTIPISDILVISTLKYKFQSSAQCLCIRTIHDDTVLLRGKNPGEIERWAFVLQKICSLTKMAKEYKMMLARKQKTAVPVAQQYANNVSGPPQRQRSRSQKSKTRAERRAEYEQAAALALLTEEKSDWINTWRQSLTDVEMEMMIPDLTSLPEDEERLSIASGMTSISMRGRAAATAALGSADKANASNATLKGFKSLPNLRPKSSSRVLVSERRRGTSDYPENGQVPLLLNNRRAVAATTKSEDEEDEALEIQQSINVKPQPLPTVTEPNDDTSTVESAPPRTPSRRLSSPLNKKASESMPMIRRVSTTLSDAPSLLYANRHHLKKPSYARSEMI